MKSATAQIGTLGELAVAQDLTRRGFYVFTSVDGQAPVDILALKDGKVLRIQVKACAVTGDTLPLRMKSSRGQRYTSDDVDVMAVCALDKQRVAYVPIDAIDSAFGFQLRFTPPKNGQCKRTHNFDDFESVPERK